MNDINWKEVKWEFLVAYGTPDNMHGASLREMLIPVIRAMHHHIDEGIERDSTKENLLKLKAMICHPAENGWINASVEQVREEALKGEPYETYGDMELYQIQHYSQSMDLVPDQDEFVLGNFCDVCLYYVSKSKNGVWRVPTAVFKKASAA